MKCFTFYFAHETNSFSPVATSIANFEETGLYRPGHGDPRQHLESIKGAGDFVREADARGHEIVVGTCAGAQPSAPCVRADYEALRDEILGQLEVAMPVDFVLVMMHGSMMAEGYDDCEGDILARMRNIIGPVIPVGVLLDLHCNITRQMLAHATVIMPCKEYPHTDFAERAGELYHLVEAAAQGKARPVPSFFRVPVLGLFETVRSPMKELVERLSSTEKQPSVLTASLAHGFPWGDFPEAGAGALVYTDNNKVTGDEMAAELGRAFFDLRECAQATLLSSSELVERLRHHRKDVDGTIVVADMADNPGGGSASDSTFILSAFIEAGIRDAVLGYFWDPDMVDRAFEAGEGATLELGIGGKVSPSSGEPVTMTVTVKALRTNAKQPHIADGTACPLGRTALVEGNGIHILLNDLRQQPFHPRGFETAGIDPWSTGIVVVKSSHHFFAGFGERASAILYVDTPGTLHANPKMRPYVRIGRPIWPLDDISL
ncbi:M81 family metallopeptidase [Pseudokordiimonas caeni]|uniref:M81 family metallopeptidase n=1 Tax=Pseudokordiimonas caeni TaxID=2997908 RepID=UPI002810B047|nr:M81 family metallopeptidase [Pseudokordiimonas caeni]